MIGQQFRNGFIRLLSSNGSTVVVLRDYGKPTQTTVFTGKALKNRKQSGGREEVFQFEDRNDAQNGDVIQQKNSNDLWTITDPHDHVTSDTFIYFEVAVERATSQGTTRPTRSPTSAINIGGNVYGAVQVGSPNATQNVTVTVNQQWDDAMKRLRAAVKESDLDDLDKEEVAHTLDRVGELSKKEKNEKTLKAISEKLGIVSKMISVSTGLAKIAGPLIAMLQ